jgi:hypothetical protein
MFRISHFALAFAICMASLSCQTYSTGLEKSVERGNETTAIAALHTISSAQQAFAVTNNGNYGSLEQLTEGGYLDARFQGSDGGLKDYALTMTTQPAGSFSCNADPRGSGPQAGRHFYIDSTSTIIHVNPSERATAADPPLQP